MQIRVCVLSYLIVYAFTIGGHIIAEGPNSKLYSQWIKYLLFDTLFISKLLSVQIRVKGIEKSDELARQEAASVLIGPEPFCGGIPKCSAKSALKLM